MKQTLLVLSIFISSYSFSQSKFVIKAGSSGISDTTIISTRAWRQKGIDSVQGNIIQAPTYTIEKIGSTFYARGNSSYTSYSNTTFNAVLNSAMSQLTTGGVIHIKQGFYDNLNFDTIPYSKITIEGEGRYLTKLKLKSSADASVSTFGTGMFYVNSKDSVTFRNIELDGNGVNQTKIDNNATGTARLVGINSNSNYTVVDNCYIHDFTVYGYYSTVNATNNIIRNSIFSNSYWNQVTFDENTSNCTIENSEVIGGADVGVSCYGTGHKVTNNVVKNSYGTHGSTGSAWGISTEVGNTIFANNIKISGNVITGNTSMKKGIATAVSNHITIENNRIYNINSANSMGIDLITSTYCDVKGNVIDSVLTVGIHLDGSSKNNIIGNTVGRIGTESSGSNGRAFFAEAYSADRIDSNNIKGNTLKGGRIGLIINANGTGNVISDNTIDGRISYDIDDQSSGNFWTDNYGIKSGAWLPGKEDLKSNIESPTFTTKITTPIVYGDNSSAGTLTLATTSNATKGKILFGTSVYDEVNNRLGVNYTTPSSTFFVNGSFATGWSSTASSLTMNALQCFLEVTATGQTITLPTAGAISGREYQIKLTASGSCTVATTSSQTIDGSTTYSLSAQYKYIRVKSNGTNWLVIANN